MDTFHWQGRDRHCQSNGTNAYATWTLPHLLGSRRFGALLVVGTVRGHDYIVLTIAMCRCRRRRAVVLDGKGAVDGQRAVCHVPFAARNCIVLNIMRIECRCSHDMDYGTHVGNLQGAPPHKWPRFHLPGSSVSRSSAS